MRASSNRYRSREQKAEAEVIVYTDDGGSGLLMACTKRFPAPDYVVECDARHTVWIRSADGSRSLGLAPWQLRDRSLEELLAYAEKRLGRLETKRT